MHILWVQIWSVFVSLRIFIRNLRHVVCIWTPPLFDIYTYAYTYARWQSIFCRCSQNLKQSTHRIQDRYLLNGRFQTTLEDLALQMGLWLTYRPLILQLFYQCFYDYHYHHRYHYSYHNFIITILLCAIGHYFYCRGRNTNDCLQLQLQ